MRLIQWNENGKPGAGVVGANGAARRLRDVASVYDLALLAMQKDAPLAELADSLAAEEADYERLLAGGFVLPPLTHPQPTRLMVSGTGLTHLGSAKTRDSMHTQQKSETPQTDSMRMFQLGVEGGKPPAGRFWGAQPEWFYKGDGNIVAPPGGELPRPAYALDGGEEPEVVGLYVIDKNGAPRRLGFALGNEYSDHIMEKQNYLWLAHSKLRHCALGPELLLGDLPQTINGTSLLRRDGKTVWEKPFYSGEEHMCHGIANLERHHFKYDAFCAPGAAHAHFFGTATLSFADGIAPQDGDEFAIESPAFGKPLVNRLRLQKAPVYREARPL